MTTTKTALALLAGLLVLSAEAAAQPATPLPPPNGDSIIQELRLLRQAFEKQSGASARAQILASRLGVADRRLARAQKAADRLDEEAFTLEQQRRRMETEVRDLARAIEQEADPRRRTEMEGPLRAARARLTDHMTVVAQVESRRSRARQSLAAEQTRYQDLDAQLAELERELGRDMGPPR